MFNKKIISKEIVTLKNGGKVYFNELTHGILSKVSSKSTISSGRMNNALFLYLMEQELVRLSKRKINNLCISDGKIIRKKVREILKKEGILSEDTPTDTNANMNKKFNPEEVNWFNEKHKEQQDKLKEYARKKR